jgi:hypothetical protein
MARLREMPRALERDEPPAGQLGDGDGALARLAPVELAVDDEHRAANAAAQRARLLLARKRQRRLHIREHERLGASVQAPLDTVLDVLRRVRLRNLLGEEELEKAAIVPTPVVDVPPGPALVRVERLAVSVRVASRTARPSSTNSQNE